MESIDRKRRSSKEIKTAAAAFRASLPDSFLDCATFVPIPPSKSKSDPLYDDRIIRLINEIRLHPALDVRELVVQKISTEPVHSSEQRMSPDQIEAIYSIDASMLNPAIQIIAIFDDMLTTGAHYRAMASLLSKNIPNAQIAGFFVARRVPETIDFEG